MEDLDYDELTKQQDWLKGSILYLNYEKNRIESIIQLRNLEQKILQLNEDKISEEFQLQELQQIDFGNTKLQIKMLMIQQNIYFIDQEIKELQQEKELLLQEILQDIEGMFEEIEFTDEEKERLCELKDIFKENDLTDQDMQDLIQESELEQNKLLYEQHNILKLINDTINKQIIS
jgi:hypothetical protein